MNSILRALAYGLFPTAFAALVSWIIARMGFENTYYMGQLLPLFMVLYLLGAWIIYLKKTSFLQARSAETTIRRQETQTLAPATILLASACELALLATVLYRCFGVGARYYK